MDFQVSDKEISSSDDEEPYYSDSEPKGLSAYEKMIESNRRAKLAYIESLKLDELKDGLKDTVKPMATRKKREKPIEVEKVEARKSERSTKSTINLSEKSISKRAYGTTHRQKKFFPPRNPTDRNTTGRNFRKVNFVSYTEVKSDDEASEADLIYYTGEKKNLKRSKPNVIHSEENSAQLITKEDIIVSSKEFIEKLKMMKCKNLSVVVSRELADKHLYERNIVNSNQTVTKSEVLTNETHDESESYSESDECESVIEPVVFREKLTENVSSKVANKSDYESSNNSLTSDRDHSYQNGEDSIRDLKNFFSNHNTCY